MLRLRIYHGASKNPWHTTGDKQARRTPCSQALKPTAPSTTIAFIRLNAHASCCITINCIYVFPSLEAMWQGRGWAGGVLHGLAVVEVAVAGGRHDDLVAGLRGAHAAADALLGTAPRSEQLPQPGAVCRQRTSSQSCSRPACPSASCCHNTVVVRSRAHVHARSLSSPKTLIHFLHCAGKSSALPTAASGSGGNARQKCTACQLAPGCG